MTVYGLGDFLCQAAVEERGFFRQNPYVFSRTTRMSLIGGFIAMPIVYANLNFLMPRVANLGILKNAGHWTRTAACVLIDQTLVAYSFQSFLMFQYNFCKNFDVKRAWEHQRKLMPTVILAKWKVYPAVQLINLGLLPPTYRVPVTNVVGMFWNLYISWMNQYGNTMIEIKTE